MLILVFGDLISNSFSRRHLLELLLHHVVVLCCALPCALFEQFAGLTMMAMTVEANSIFLHSRRLLKFCHQTGGFYYILNAILNVLTNIIFRLAGFSWIIVYTVRNFDKLGMVWSSVCITGATVVLVMSFILLLRCIKVDFFLKNRNKIE